MSKHSMPPGKNRPVRRAVIVILLSNIFVLVAACVGVAALGHRDGGPAISAQPEPQSGSAQSKTFTPPKNWPVTFKATFTGSKLDTKIWDTCYPWQQGGCTNYGNVTDEEQEWYLAGQDKISGGVLKLEAKREPTPGVNQQGDAKEYTCRSGMVTTYPGFNFKYGYIQVTGKIPFGKGLWPAFWLAAANEKWPPEIDILEHWHNQLFGSVYLHDLAGKRLGGHVQMPDLSSGWHTFGVDWTKNRLTWYYDGTQVFTTSTGVPQQAMYFLADLADDDASAGTCTGSLAIKSVEVWQPAA
jgi:beta-glucanase (GH16 family)